MLNINTLTYIKLLLTVLIFLMCDEAFAQDKSSLITYIHPKPGADYITPQSSILKIGRAHV